jgi:hypothetical protein
MKRTSELANPKTPVSSDKSYSPERRAFKKTKLSVEPKQNPRNQSPKKSEQTNGFAPFKPNAASPQMQTAGKEMGQTSANSMSNLYNAYMARMFPFMYNPLQMQYAAAVASSQQQTPAQNSNFFGMLNQNLGQFGSHQSRYAEAANNNGNGNPFTSIFSNISSNNNNHSSSSSSSDELPTNSSYSASSRSSSLSPSNKTSEMKQMCSSSTSTHENHSPLVKLEKMHTTPVSEKSQQQPKPELGLSGSVGVKKSFNIEQMLNTKVNKETQTESACLNCPYCSNKCL